MAILDQYGNEIRNNKPIRGEIAIDTFRSRYSTYPTQGMTPEKLATVLKEADLGNVYRQAEMFEEMEEKDCTLSSILGTRRGAVSGLKWEVLPATDSREDKKIAQAGKEMLESLESLRDTLFDIGDAVGKGFAMCEIMWDPTPSACGISEIKWVHQKKFTFYAPADWGSTILQYPRLLTDAEPIFGEEVPANKFVYHRHKARSGSAPRGGLSRPCAYMWLFKNFDIKDWLIFNDLYSVPMRIGKYKSGSTPDEIDILKRATMAVAVDAAAVISDNTLIELLETKSTGDAKGFQMFADFCDRSMTKAVLGHTGAVESASGKLGNEDQAKEVRQDLLEADAEALETCVKFQILKPWVAFNFGPDKAVPKFKLHYEAPDDLEKAAKVYGILVKDVGFNGIPQSHIYDRFGIPQPKAGEVTVQPPAAPAGGGDLGLGLNDNGNQDTTKLANKAALPATLDGSNQVEAGLTTKLALTADSQTSEWVAQLRALVMNASSLEELAATILSAYPGMSVDGLAGIMAQEAMRAAMAGRIDAESGA